RLSGVPQKTISRIENGIDIPKISTLIKLINALNLELSIVDKDSKKEQSATLQ
ncbi:helix-turn-helix domain-containing protein, partial [Bacillus inaquosorum]